jgi:protein-S-isoprenylcysteine O-methyltransferase Ste14
MTEVFAALRTLVYASGFVLVWGWVAEQARPLDGGVALPPSARTVGIVLMILGGIVAVAAASWFVVAGRGTPAPFDPPRRFVPSGPYRWVRNPMYVGAFGVLAGWGLWQRSLPVALVAVPAALAAHLFVIFYEEPSLRRRFGAPYERYLTLVNRWIPRVPRRDQPA